MLTQWTYGEVLDHLQALKAYLIRLKVHNVPSRLLATISDLRELAEAHRENRTADLNHRAGDLVWSVVEGWQFATIFDGIRDYDPTVLKKQLMKAPKGRTTRRMKTEAATRAATRCRTLLPAQFQRAGEKITIAQDADLRIDYEGASYINFSIGSKPTHELMSLTAWSRSRFRMRSIQARQCM